MILSNMVNLRNYSADDDFQFHRDEFDRSIKEIKLHYDITGKTALDLCSGAGIHSGFLSLHCSHVFGVDLLDYELAWNGMFKYQLRDLFKKHNVAIDITKMQFIKMDAQNLLFKDNLFDFVWCVNAFEHIPDPEKALDEIYRVLKPEGIAWIQFDPVYYCDTGSHMFDFLPEPWGHLMYQPEEYAEKLRAVGTPQEMVNDFLYGLNRKPKKYFIDLFNQKNTFKVLSCHEWSGLTKDEFRQHPNYSLLKSRYSEEDLFFRGAHFLIKKLKIPENNERHLSLVENIIMHWRKYSIGLNP